METLILYVEETINENGANENEPEVKYSIRGYNTDICRLCLELSQLQPINNCQFIKEFNNFMFIEVQLGVRFPKSVCEKCLNKLSDMGSFLKMCQNSLNTYKKMEENCAKLRGTEVATEDLEQAETELGNVNVKAKESVPADAIVSTKNFDEKVEPIFSKIKKEIVVPEGRDENIDANNELAEKNIPEFIVTKNTEQALEKKIEHNIMCNIKQNSVASKMCYTCGVCVISLAIHYKTSTSCKPKNFKCSLCNLHFATKHRMLSHQRVSHWDKISAKHFVCHICSKMFKHAETLKRHVRLHKHGKEYMCEVCGKNYTRQADLRDHKNIHSQLKPYSCRCCGKSFHAKSNRFAHEIRHHKENSLEDKLKAAMIPLHLNCSINNRDNERAKYECNTCKIQFEDIFLYKQHQEMHTHEYYACPCCQKRFLSPLHLGKHMRLHTGERRFLCSECGKKFRTSGHLKRHTLLIHNVAQVKPFQCKFCEKTFNLKENLLVHERIHTGERPYKCHICDKCFKDATSRKKHIKKMHGEDQVNNIYN